MSLKPLSLIAACAALAFPAIAQDGERQVAKPGEAPVDVFHPDNLAGKPQPAPRWGGRVIIHIPSLPENLNYAVENSSYTRRMLQEAHEMLVHQDWETHEFVPRAAESWVTEDMLVLDPAKAGAYGDAVVETKVRTPGVDGEQIDALVVYGDVSDNGGSWRVRPVSEGSALSEPLEVAKGDVKQVELGSVFTFSIREGVKWHPSMVYADDAAAVAKMGDQFLDARDVHFSWSIYANPSVDCDEKRFQFVKVTKGEVVDDMTVRFFYEKQYAFAIDSIGNSLTLLPSHLYDLTDPDNPAHDAGASPEKQAEHINKNPHNRQWVGIGPYHVVEYSQQWVQMERFEDYFEPENGGYVDAIRYRLIEDDETAFSALINGEVDWFERVKSADYFGARTETEQFKANFYKGYFYLGTYGYTGW
ncbi:MAG: ABC transporter substrate-binding protein, partial [Planctomycetota bacterium]